MIMINADFGNPPRDNFFSFFFFFIIFCNDGLKVGSCPDDDSSVQIFLFVLFRVIIIISESVAAEKAARFCRELASFHVFISLALEFPFSK